MFDRTCRNACGRCSSDVYLSKYTLEITKYLNQAARTQAFVNLHTSTSRLSSEVDMSRVLFVPRMEHHHLLAMYSLADVVLDSVYFGGDTTSREAFETGAPVITLPYKTIGQRWTQAYYRMMGIEDYIASNPDHYAELAVNTAKKTSREKINIRKRIKRLAHEKLYRIEDGVKYWVQAFLDIATRPLLENIREEYGTFIMQASLFIHFFIFTLKTS